MSELPPKRRRIAHAPCLDLEVAFEREQEENNDTDRAFIDNEPKQNVDEETSARRAYKIRQELVDILEKDGHLDGGAILEEEEHAGLLREWLGLEFGDGNNLEGLAVWDNDNFEDEQVAIEVSQPQRAEIAYNNVGVAGARSTCHDDDEPERRISQQDLLFEVSCQPGMEETIVFRIFSWALQVNSAGPTEDHILACSTASTPSESGLLQKGTPLARSAVANPFLRGRVYIESANITYVQSLARRVRGLNPASVRLVPRELLLRPLRMTRHLYPDRTFVRLLDPPCPSMTCLIVKDYLLMVPRSKTGNGLFSSSAKINLDEHLMPEIPPESRTGDSTFEGMTPVHAESNILIDKYGFRYIPLRDLPPSALEPYEPSVSEIELLFTYHRLNNQHYTNHMSRVMAYSFLAGDRVIIQGGVYDQLAGTILNLGDENRCSIYIPSQGNIIQVARSQLRRQFRVGDRVSTITDDVAQRLGSRFGWVVSASKGYKTMLSSIEEIDSARFRVDLRVYSSESDKEIIAAHYEFQFEDDRMVSLQTVQPSSPVSIMTIGTPYTLTIRLNSCRYLSFFGVITAIEGVRVQVPGTTSTEMAGTIIFSFWDRSADAPFGYSADWIGNTVNFLDYYAPLGETVILKDREGRGGTARVTSLRTREVVLGNFTGALKFSNLEAAPRAGPYDGHIGKTVSAVKGPYRGSVGVVKTVNAAGTCTVELNIQPIRKITVNLSSLRAVDESQLYMSLASLLYPPPCSATPPAPPASSDTLLAPQPSSANTLPLPPQPFELDCHWLSETFAQNIPIKLQLRDRDMQRPYHFSNTFYDTSGELPRLMVRVFDRKKERDFSVDKLRWLPPTDINQTVVRITGASNSTLYFTILFDGDHCRVRQVPSRRGGTLYTFPRLELAQVNARRN